MLRLEYRSLKVPFVSNRNLRTSSCNLECRDGGPLLLGGTVGPVAKHGRYLERLRPLKHQKHFVHGRRQCPIKSPAWA